MGDVARSPVVLLYVGKLRSSSRPRLAPGLPLYVPCRPAGRNGLSYLADDDPDAVNDAGHEEQQAKHDIDKKVLGRTDLHKYTNRWQQHRQNDEYDFIVYLVSLLSLFASRPPRARY